jgi:serine protease inhibitor
MARKPLKRIAVMAGPASVFLLLMFGGMDAKGMSSLNAPKDDDLSRLVAAQAKFGFSLFKKLVTREPRGNVFVSPMSIAMALTMTYNGATGETRKAMARSLELEGMDPEDVNRAYARLRNALVQPDPKIELALANSLWARKGVTFKAEFMKTNETFYQAEISFLDFSDPDAPSRINQWVDRNTKGKIDQIIDRIDPSAILYLLNAIYFKGVWTKAFDPKKTREDLFTLLDGSSKRHPFMQQSGRYRYFRGETFQAVSLPYGEGRMSMYIFLPERRSSLKEFEGQLTAEHWTLWMRQFREMEGAVFLPRFKLKYEEGLNQALTALGMGEAFDRNRAEFGAMCSIPPRVFINQVKHKAFVEVNEEGTEAAAVTSVEIRVTAVPSTFTLKVDRPFFCAIVDKETNAILFMGSIAEPM